MRKLLAIAFLALLGCGEKGPESIKLIDFDAVSKVSTDLFIEKAILLESDSNELLGEYLKVTVGPQGFYVMNYNGAKGIHHFSMEGRHLGMIAEVGEAPGQVRNIKEFRVFEDELLVMSGMGNSMELHAFSEDHNLAKTTAFPLNVFTFYPREINELWFYSGYNWMAGDHRLFTADGEGKIKKKLLPNDFFEKMIPIDEQSFFKGDNKVLFREPFKTSVYKLTELDSLEEVMRFDFGKSTVPKDFWEMDPFKGFEMISKQGFSDINFIEENGGFLIADIVTQKEQERKRELYILEKSANKEFKVEFDEDLGYFNSPFGLSDDQILFIAYAPYIIRNRDKLKMSEEAKSALLELTEDSNPVILYAKIPK